MKDSLDLPNILHKFFNKKPPFFSHAKKATSFPISTATSSSAYEDIVNKSPIKNFIFLIEKNNNDTIKLLNTIKFSKSKNLILLKNILTFDCHTLAGNINLLTLNETENYYSLFFKILKISFPTENLDELINNFLLYCEKQLKTYKKQHNNASISLPLNLYIAAKSTKNFIEKKFSILQNKIIYLICGTTYKKSLVFLVFLLVVPPVVIPIFFNISPFSIKKLDTVISKKSSTLWNVPRQDYTFIGRKKILGLLSEKFASSFFYRFFSKEKHINNNLNVTCLVGLGGIGKTQLALQYVHKNENSYTLCGWFFAENTDHLYQNYIEFAKFLGYKDEQPNITKVISYVKNWLENNPGWLLVYDNVSNYEKISPFLPKKGGHIIITTRQQQWPDKFKILPVTVMTEQEAFDLMSVLTKKDIKKKEVLEAKKLLKAIGYLPLAIAQAGTYIYQNKIKISEYLDIYKKYEQDLLSDLNHTKEKKNANVATTWNISLNAIIKESRSNLEKALTKNLLIAFAYLAPEKISREMLVLFLKTIETSLPSPEITLNRLLRRLWKYSIITYDENGFIFIHRLVQSVLRKQYSALNKSNTSPRLIGIQDWYTALLKSMDAFFHKKRTTLKKEQARKFILPHLQSLVQHYDSQNWKNKSLLLALSHILKNIGGVFHFYIGEPHRAKPYYQRSLSIKKKYYGEHHIDIAKTLRDFGDAYGALGNPNKQKDFLEKALHIAEKECGKNHKELIPILESLGAAHWALGNSRKSRDILIKGLTLGEKTYGVNSIKIAKILYYLGNVYGDLGEWYNEIKMLERALKINEQNYGKSHIRISFILENLGMAYNYLGKAKKSKKLLSKALLLQERYYGKNHVEVGETLANLSNTYLALNEPLVAKKLLKRSLMILKKYYGDEHMYFARTLNYLGDAHIALKEYKKAIKTLKYTLKIKVGSYGKNHFSTARTKASLAQAYLHTGNLEKAALLVNSALNAQKKHYGTDHPIAKKTLLLQKNIKISLSSNEKRKDK